MSQVDLIEKDNKAMMTDKHTTLIAMLDSMLNANVPLVGISVLEILNSLFNHLIKTVQLHPFIKTPPADPSNAYTIQEGLVCSIGGLSTCYYYENQFSDVIGYLIAKLRINTLLETVDDIPLYEYRVIVIRCLTSAIRGFAEAVPSSSCQMRQGAALDTWTPSLGLLYDANAKTRIEFSRCLYEFLRAFELPTPIQ
jgi:hypothetical protein